MANINKVQFLKDLLVPNLTVNGDLTVKGKSIVEDSTGKLIEDAFVVVNPAGTETSTTLIGEVFITNNEEAYAIAYDPTIDSIRLGKGTYSNNQFTFDENEGFPIAIRDLSDSDNNYLVRWDSYKNCLVKSPLYCDDSLDYVRTDGSLFAVGGIYLGDYGTLLDRELLNSLINHDHDEEYAPKNHNHNGVYAPNDHQHDSITNSGYELRISGATGELDFNGVTLSSDELTQIINLINHNHDSAYAAKSHASSGTTYGVGTTTYYGHVKISNEDVSTTSHTNGVVAGMDHTHSEYSQNNHTHSEYSPNNHTHTEISDLEERVTDLENGGTVVSEIYWGSF